MSDKNREIVEKINAAFAEGNTEGFLGECTDNVEWTIVGDKTVYGKDNIREFMKEMEGSEPPAFSADRIIAEGDSVACYGKMTMKGEDGNAADYEYCDLYGFTGDKISWMRSFVVKVKDEGAETAAGTAG